MSDQGIRAIPVMMAQPLMNAAQMAYVPLEDVAKARQTIADLRRQVAALERYLDRGKRFSASGVPLTRR